MEAALDPSCLLCVTPQGWWSPIRQGVVWPGAPRNFATEPATWYDLGVQQQDIGGADDASFLLDFYWTASAPADKRVLYNAPLGSRFSVFAYADGRVNVFTNLVGTQFISYVSLTVVGTGSGLSVGRHRIFARVVGTTFYAKLDKGAELSTTGIRSNVTSFTAPITEAPMTIYEAWERNDFTSKKVWSYSSYAERLRLVTYANARTDRGRFEAANVSLGWSIKTAAPTGLTGTVLAKINGAVVTNPAKWNRTTATFTGLAADTLEWLMVRSDTMTAGQIAYLSN